LARGLYHLAKFAPQDFGSRKADGATALPLPPIKQALSLRRSTRNLTRLVCRTTAVYTNHCGIR